MRPSGASLARATGAPGDGRNGHFGRRGLPRTPYTNTFFRARRAGKVVEVECPVIVNAAVRGVYRPRAPVAGPFDLFALNSSSLYVHYRSAQHEADRPSAES